MYLYNQKRPILIFGSSKRAVLKYYLWKNDYTVIGFLENDRSICEQKKFLGKPLYFVSEIYKLLSEFPEALIVIADDRYVGLARWLNKNFQFLKDWIVDIFFEYTYIELIPMREIALNDYQIDELIDLMKKKQKIFFIFGNCQTIVEKMYLLANERFNKEYIILYVPPIHLFPLKHIDICQRGGWYHHIDVCAIMNISDENRIHPSLSTQSFMRNLGEQCQVIIIPNFWFTAYYPQLEKKHDDVLGDYFPRGFSRWGDSILDEQIREGFTYEEVMFKCDKLINDEMINRTIDECFKNLREVEVKCSIKC